MILRSQPAVELLRCTRTREEWAVKGAPKARRKRSRPLTAHSSRVKGCEAVRRLSLSERGSLAQAKSGPVWFRLRRL